MDRKAIEMADTGMWVCCQGLQMPADVCEEEWEGKSADSNNPHFSLFWPLLMWCVFFFACLATYGVSLFFLCFFFLFSINSLSPWHQSFNTPPHFHENVYLFISVLIWPYLFIQASKKLKKDSWLMRGV